MTMTGNELWPSSEGWMEAAVCAQADPELYFPKKGGNGLAAKALCATCPVVDSCLDYAIREAIPHGVFGGLAPYERAGLRAPKPADAATVKAMRMRAAGQPWPDIAALLELPVNTIQKRVERYRAAERVAS